MKKLAISVIWGILLFSSSAMSTEHYEPREFWNNEEVVKSTLEKAYNIACEKKARRLFKCSGSADRFLAREMTDEIYQSVASENNCLTTLAKEEFLTSLGLSGLDEMKWIPWENTWSFLSYVGSILGKKIH